MGSNHPRFGLKQSITTIEKRKKSLKEFYKLNIVNKRVSKVNKSIKYLDKNNEIIKIVPSQISAIKELNISYNKFKKIIQ